MRIVNGSQGTSGEGMDYLEFAQDVVRWAVDAGAEEAEVYIQNGEEFGVDVRMGQVETLTQSASKGMGIRVFVDKRMAFSSTTDFEPSVVRNLVSTTVQLAKAAGRDRFNGLPNVDAGRLPDLDLFDPAVAGMTAERKIEMAKEAEQAAFDFDSRITNSEGAGFGSYVGSRFLANSNGIAYSSSSTNCSLSCSPLAEQDGDKQVSYDWTSKRFLGDIDSSAEVGRRAAERTVAKLGARKVETANVPVVFSWMVAPMLLGAVFAAIDGDSAHRGLSFLRKMVGKQVAAPLITVIDDALMPRGLGSIPFDGEGVLTGRKVVIENGVLNMYFYDARTGRKYGHLVSGNARRGFGSTPSVSATNLYIRPSETDPSDIIAGIGDGFYVTETMGRGANVVTGDFSIGASGMWIKDGRLAFPVQEVTIAGHMLDMLRGIEQVGSDARFISSVVSPTLKISEMTVSGK